MNGTDIAIAERIRAFAASVRQHLDDLPEDELDDILGGLSADLADQAADNDGVLELGDPAAYAEELRSAAGLPPRGEKVERRPLGERFTDWRRGVADSIRRSAFGAWALDFLVAMRPLWWVLRGFGIYALAILLPTTWIYPYQAGRGVFPVSPIEGLLLFAFVVLSVQWGRGHWLPKTWMRGLRLGVSIVAVLILPVALYSLLTPRVEYVDNGSAPWGLQLDGVQIGNIFAFDENGEPIEHVQLYTGKGTPLNLYGADSSAMEIGQLYDDGETLTVPFRDYRNQPVWNVFPLDEGTLNLNTGEAKKSSIRQPSPPFQRAPGVTATVPTPTPTPAPTDAVTDPAATPAP